MTGMSLPISLPAAGRTRRADLLCDANVVRIRYSAVAIGRPYISRVGEKYIIDEQTEKGTTIIIFLIPSNNTVYKDYILVTRFQDTAH